MSETLMEIFDGIEKARASRNSDWVKEGHYIYSINKVKAGKNRKEEKFMCLELTILHTWEGEQKVGQSVSHMLMKKHDSFLGNVKAMIAAICEVDEDKVTQQDCATVCLDDGSENAQPLSGVVVECVNTNIVTKSGGTFTQVKYKGIVPFSKLKKILPDDSQIMFFPDGELDQLAAEEE